MKTSDKWNAQDMGRDTCRDLARGSNLRGCYICSAVVELPTAVRIKLRDRKRKGIRGPFLLFFFPVQRSHQAVMDFVAILSAALFFCVFLLFCLQRSLHIAKKGRRTDQPLACVAVEFPNWLVPRCTPTDISLLMCSVQPQCLFRIFVFKDNFRRVDID